MIIWAKLLTRLNDECVLPEGCVRLLAPPYLSEPASAPRLTWKLDLWGSFQQQPSRNLFGIDGVARRSDIRFQEKVK